MPLTTVLIADLEKAGRATCRRLLQPEKKIRVVGEARSGPGAMAATVRLKPRVLLLDRSLVGGKGAALVSPILEKSPDTRIILLTERASDASILDALSQGAVGCLAKKRLPSEPAIPGQRLRRKSRIACFSPGERSLKMSITTLASDERN